MEPNNNPAPNPAGGIIQPEGGAPVPQTPMPDQSAGQKPPSGKGRKLALIILAVLALLLLAGGAYYMYFRDSDEPEAPQQSQQQESESSEEVTQFSCEEGFTEFQGDNIGLHFCYPVSWGNASLEDSQEAEMNHLTAGSHKIIRFSGKDTVTAILMSKNWEHDQEMGHGGIPGEYGKKTLAQAKEAKSFTDTEPEHIYVDSDKQFAFVYVCGQMCNSEAAAVINLSFTTTIEGNDTYEVIEFVQAGDALPDGADEETVDPAALFAKTDSRFTVLQQVADSVRN